jgi:hypothetical protein
VFKSALASASSEGFTGRVTRAIACAIVAGVSALGFVQLGACAGDTDLSGIIAADASVDRAADTVQPVADAADAARQEAAAIEASTIDAANVDAAACNVRVAAVPIVDGTHVADGTAIAYSSNPPSSGSHYGTWANFQELTHPVDDGYLVHSMEHGAVLLLYKCAAAGAACDALVSSLRAVRDSIPTDPLCDAAIRVRVILAPRAANDVAVAAAAWGNTYRADCVDAASLASFINDHYAKAPENFCAAGQVF